MGVPRVVFSVPLLPRKAGQFLGFAVAAVQQTGDLCFKASMTARKQKQEPPATNGETFPAAGPPASYTFDQRLKRTVKTAFPWQGGLPFKKGQSGNPGGLSKFYSEARRLARDAAPEMMQGLIDLAKSAEDERVRSVCLIAVLDRAGVKAIDYDPNQDKQQSAFNIGALDASQRAQLRQLLELACANPELPAEPADESEPG